MLEKNIVNHIIENWDKFFSGVHFYKKEYQVTDSSRCDLLAYVNKLDSATYRDNVNISDNYRIPIFIEVKWYNSRDLTFELTKLINHVKRNWHDGYPKYIGVICDSETLINHRVFLKDNGILVWVIEGLEQEELENMKLSLITDVDNYQIQFKVKG